MIEVCGLTKRYGFVKALEDVSFEVNKGEIVGFLGPNGAGKSTAMNIICGYIGASEGSVKVDGFEISQRPAEVKKRIGYLPEMPPLYPNMSVREYLEFVYELKNVKLSKRTHIDEIERITGISDVSGRIIKNLSKGYKQRVGLAQALIGNPPVLILDEPSVGLDPAQIIEMRNLIKSLGSSHTIILSSHILSEVSAVCDRVIIINNGAIIAEDTPENLSRTLAGANRYSALIEGDSDVVNALLMSLSGVSGVRAVKVTDEGTYYEIESQSDIRSDLTLTLASGGFAVKSLVEESMSLEEVFIRLTDDSAKTALPDAEEEAEEIETEEETEEETETEEIETQEETGDESDI